MVRIIHEIEVQGYHHEHVMATMFVSNASNTVLYNTNSRKLSCYGPLYRYTQDVLPEDFSRDVGTNVVDSIRDLVEGVGGTFVIGDGVEIESSVIKESTVGDETTVGPFAYIRPGSRIGKGCKVGDFVEVKNSTLGDGTKSAHLTYIGDADLGKNINLGCGVVFVNYDGTNKYRSTVGDGAFIGCNANIVSPVSIGDGAYIAAGSTVTKNVEEDALCVARTRQKNIQGWAKQRGLYRK